MYMFVINMKMYKFTQSKLSNLAVFIEEQKKITSIIRQLSCFLIVE